MLLIDDLSEEELREALRGLNRSDRLAEREGCEASLYTFLRYAWPQIDPAPFRGNWHLEVMCSELEALARGEVRDLVINVPPRTAKSTIVSVAFPSWMWTQQRDPDYPLMGPHCSFLGVSYGATLAEVAAVKMLRLVLGEWYQSHWGDRVKIRGDQMSRQDFGNEAGGERISVSIEGGILGRGALIQLVDDAHRLDQVESDRERERVVRALREGLPTRVTDPTISARIMVMQRLHQLDATAYALAEWRPDLRHIMLPMRFDPSRACDVDQRTEAGELLWPEHWTEEAVSQTERQLGPYAAAGQFAQSPTPRGGGIIKREWIEPWPPLSHDGTFPADMVDAGGRIRYPALEYVVACVDTAFTKKQERDRSAMVVLGLFRAEGKGRIERRGDGTFVRVADDYGFPKVLILHSWANRLELHGPPEEIPGDMTAAEWNSPGMKRLRSEHWGLVETVADECRRYKVDHLVILTLGQGHGLEQELRRLHSDGDWGVSMVLERGDKEARAYAQQHLFSGRQVYAPTYEDGTMPSWAEPLIEELVIFPRGTHDDYVDATLGGLKWLRDIGLMERREQWDRSEEHRMSHRANRRRGLPYPV